MTHPPITIPRRICLEYVRTSPYIFIFSSSVHTPKFTGQSSVGLAYPDKCFGVPTIWKACPNGRHISDNQFRDYKIEVDVAISKVPLLFRHRINLDKPFDPTQRDESMIIPFPKIGEGYSRLFELAPKCYKYLKQEIEKIAYPNITYK